MERSVYKVLSMLRLPETRVCLIFAVLVTLLVLLNKHLIQDPFSQDVKIKKNISLSDLLLNGDTFSDDSLGVTFIERHCDLQDIDWFPEDKTNAWQQRAPYFLLLGVGNVGLSRLERALQQHPNIFRMPLVLPTMSLSRTRVKDVRSNLYNQTAQTLSYSNPALFGFGSDPDFIFQSTAPFCILCVCPWVKIMVVVQNPIDRIVSSWNVYKQEAKTQFSLDDWIEGDLNALRQSGVMKNLNSSEQFASFLDSPQLDAAWLKYTSDGKGLSSLQPVGRSLYSIQLKNWLKAVRESGRKPTDTFLIVREEDMNNRPETLYKRTIDWLGFPPFTNLTFPPPIESIQKSSTIKNSTRQRLQQILKPYNEQMYNLLQGDWIGLWDENSEKPEGIITWPSEKRKKETDFQKYSSPAPSLQQQRPTLTHRPSPSSVAHDSFAPKTSTAPASTRPQGRPKNESIENPQNLTEVDAFVTQWCELQGSSTLYPDVGTRSWQLRAPYFILMGAKWSGASLLTSSIMQHPLVAEEMPASKEFFLERNFRKFISRSGKSKVVPARAFMYARHYNHIQRHLKGNASLISFDATLSYLFASPQIQRILCVTPWAKFVVILRDPVEQAYSIWSDAVSLGLKLDFDEWVAADIQLMRDAGLIHDWEKVTFDEFAGSQKEEHAWKAYQEVVQEGAVGRGMYEIQLRLWFRNIAALGRNPKTEVLILRAERFSQAPQTEWSRILKFLKLTDQQLSSYTMWSSSNYSQGMTDKTRNALKSFYTPYNRRLSQLIGDNPNWGGKWKDWLTM